MAKRVSKEVRESRQKRADWIKQIQREYILDVLSGRREPIVLPKLTKAQLKLARAVLRT